ncbi:hypothetical protein CHUAL_003161 [Chamberlinius hualienensis]
MMKTETDRQGKFIPNDAKNLPSQNDDIGESERKMTGMMKNGKWLRSTTEDDRRLRNMQKPSLVETQPE